jgi:hypothetical protein
MTYVNRHPRGQQRDKPYREALRLELAAAGEDMKKLREIARAHIARCETGDMQAIRELADRLDGKPAQAIEHAVPEGGDRRITEIGFRVIHADKSRAQLDALNAEEAEIARQGKLQ